MKIRRRPHLACVAICCLFATCGGGEEPIQQEAEPPVDTIEAVATTADAYEQILDQAGELTAGGEPAELKRAAGDLEKLAEEVGSVTADDGSDAVAGRLDDAAEHLGDAAEELSLTGARLSAAIRLEAREQDASEEAATRLADASTQVDRLTVRVSNAERAMTRAYKALRAAINELADDPTLGSEGERVDALGRRLAGLDRDADEGFNALRKTIATEARALAARANELTPEPPDVVQDCSSAYETVSDVSVRNMECAEADAVIIQAIPTLAPNFAVAGFSCTILGDYGPPDGPILGASDIRCEAGDRAFRFSFAD